METPTRSRIADIANQKTASNMIVTAKRCFQAFLIECVRDTVTSEDDVQEELAEIMRFFPKGAQRLE